MIWMTLIGLGLFAGIVINDDDNSSEGVDQPPIEQEPNEATAGNDLLQGTSGADSINGLDGDDEISGDKGADRLFGDDGNDTLEGGDDQDLLKGGALY